MKIKGMSDELLKSQEESMKDGLAMTAYRSFKTCNDIYFLIRKYIEDEKINMTAYRTMAGFNDRIVILSKDEKTFISFIMIWCYMDADLAVVKLNDEGHEVITPEYLEINNPEKIDREEGEIPDDIINNKTKYYADFQETIDPIVEDMKTILNKMKEGK